MKKRSASILWAAALLLLAAVLVFANLPDEKPLPVGSAVGEKLPDFSLACIDGYEFRLSEHRGQVVVINLWATWCTPCVRELPYFDRLQKEQPEQTAVLALHSPPFTADPAEFLSAFSWQIPFAVDEDGRLSDALGASTVLPQTVILSPEGLVTYNQVGSLTYEKLTELVDAARAYPSHR